VRVFVVTADQVGLWQSLNAAAYWREHVPAHPYFNRDVECFVVLLLNTRRKVLGHYLISTGTLDTILVHPPEVFLSGPGHKSGDVS
jgi:DNA repair protein RadC